MTLERDIERLAEQERRLQFTRFDAGTAWTLGIALRDAALARGVALAIEVRLAREAVFFHSMPGTTPENADWIRRKRNLVEMVQHSSYAVGRALEQSGHTLASKWGLPDRDYAAHGGGFPIVVQGVGCIGVVTVSGIPQREDHAMVAAALAGLLGLDAAALALD